MTTSSTELLEVRDYTVQKASNEVVVWLHAYRSGADVGWMGPGRSKKPDFITTIDGTLLGCTNLNEEKVEVEEEPSWWGSVNR